MSVAARGYGNSADDPSTILVPYEAQRKGLLCMLASASTIDYDLSRDVFGIVDVALASLVHKIGVDDTEKHPI
jgi:hypothetical protein